LIDRQKVGKDGECPFFRLRAGAIICPFKDIDGVYRTCREDLVHVSAVK
jgi:hypothetical protein